MKKTTHRGRSGPAQRRCVQVMQRRLNTPGRRRDRRPGARVVVRHSGDTQRRSRRGRKPDGLVPGADADLALTRRAAVDSGDTFDTQTYSVWAASRTPALPVEVRIRRLRARAAFRVSAAGLICARECLTNTRGYWMISPVTPHSTKIRQTVSAPSGRRRIRIRRLYSVQTQRGVSVPES